MNISLSERRALGPQQVTFTLAEDMVDQKTKALLHRTGETVTMTVVPSNVTVQTEEIDTYLGGYTPFGFAADMVSKVVLVDLEAGQRRDFSKENAFEVVDVTTGRLGAINQIDHLSGLTAYRTTSFALATFIPWTTENQAAYNIRAAAGEMIAWKHALAREVRTWTQLTTTANWNSANHTTLSASYYWDTGASKNPRGDIEARLEASAQPVTDIFMNPRVAFYFLGDTDVRNYMRQMLGDGAPASNVVAAAQAGDMGVQTFVVPGLPPVHIVPGKRTNASTGALEYILGDDVVLSTNQPGVPTDGNRVATSYTFRLRGRSGTGIVTNEYVPQGRGINGGTMFEMGYDEDQFIASNIAGGLIKNVLST